MLLHVIGGEVFGGAPELKIWFLVLLGTDLHEDDGRWEASRCVNLLGRFSITKTFLITFLVLCSILPIS